MNEWISNYSVVLPARPDWHLVIIGPVVKIDPAILPHRQNIHYLGPKTYKDLPAYIAGWDVALLPFARNSSTRPTKTPEYLAAGKPVVLPQFVTLSVPTLGIVRIADTVVEFVAAATAAMNENPDSSRWLHQVDGFLAQTSWDRTWTRMMQLVASKISVRLEAQAAAIGTLRRTVMLELPPLSYGLG